MAGRAGLAATDKKSDPCWNGAAYSTLMALSGLA
jgi:hypothetical protein